MKFCVFVLNYMILMDLYAIYFLVFFFFVLFIH